MINILFVCHGNICRSPMAEFVFRDMAAKKQLSEQFLIASAATSTEEIGNSVHVGTRKKLEEHGIECSKKRAVQLTRQDYKKYDFLIGMDQWNIKNMLRILRDDPEHKVYRLLDFTNYARDIADPWYTGDFDTTYDNVYEGCKALLDYIIKENLVVL